MGRIIVTAIVFFFVWRFLNSFFKPKQQTSPNSQQRKPNQKVTVQYDRDKAKSKVGNDVGEYVEFEEIKEEKK
jgi:hypothetical protein